MTTVTIPATHPGNDPAPVPYVPTTHPWMADAACIGTDPDAFTVNDSGQITRENRWVMERICGGCPVREQCGQLADEERLQGIWGGVARSHVYYHRKAAS